VLAFVLALALAAEDLGGGAPPGSGPGYGYAALPAVGFGSDVGLVVGAANFLYRASDVEGRYDRLTLSAVYTTHGPRCVHLALEQPRFSTRSWGGLLDVGLADDNREPYWGEGGALGGSPVSPGSGAAPDPFRFHARRLFLSALMRPVAAADGALYGRARLAAIDVREPSALLAAERPLGSGGGSTLLLEGGLLVDRRDREVGTRSGVYANVSLFGAPAVGPLGPGSFLGVDVAASGYWPAARWATLAAHVLLDAKIGSVPFYERGSYEGIAYGGGLGGGGTLRGVARLRMSGDEKGLATVELRTVAWEGHPMAATRLQLGVAAGVDAGFARQRGYPMLHALCGFAGLRALWDDALLLRVEVGYAGQGGAALYIVTGEQF
jgi:hypothetical protein